MANLFIVVLSLILSLQSFVLADPTTKPSVPVQLQAGTVMVSSENGYGTGVIVTRGDTSYVWTDGHVVEDARYVIKFIDPKTGKRGKRYGFEDVYVIQDEKQGGNIIGSHRYAAKVIRYSGMRTGKDLALLEIRKKNAFSANVLFAVEDTAPDIGTPIWHFGCFHGPQGRFSLSQGIISYVGREKDSKEYDQVTCTHFTGSSGGGVFDNQARCLGLIDWTLGETYGLMTPVRVIREWAKKVGVEFAMDPTAIVPTDEQLHLYPVDDVFASHIEEGEEVAIPK